MGFYLKVFLRVFMNATLGASLFWWWRFSQSFSLMETILYGLLAGSAFGFFIGLMAVLLDYLGRKAVFEKCGFESFELVQTR